MSDVSVTTAEDMQAAVAVPLTAAEPSAVTLSVVTPPAHGTLTGGGPSWTYKPAADYNGADSATVKAEDTHGSSTAKITISVTPVNDAPVAKPDSFAAVFDVPAKLAAATLLANDTDVDNATLTITAVAAATDGHGTPSMSGADITFTTESHFAGVAKFTYTVSDGMATAQATVTVNVGADEAPVAKADTIAATEDTTKTIGDADLLGNDTDPDGNTLSVSAIGPGVHGTATRTGNQISFVPDANFFGDASFDYTITDGVLFSTATVTLKVEAVDDPPVAVDDNFVVAEGVAPLALDVLGNDTDIDAGPKTIASITQAAHGAAVITGGGTGLTYAATNYCNDIPNGIADSFTYTISPGNTTATVKVKVTCACGLNKSTDFVVGSVP